MNELLSHPSVVDPPLDLPTRARPFYFISAGQPLLAHKGTKEGLVAAEAIAGKKAAYDVVGMPAVIASFVISTLAHFLVGASKALVTTRPWWASGAEMTIVGILEATITYGLGLAFAAH